MKYIEVVAAVLHQEKTYFATQRGYGEFEGITSAPPSTTIRHSI